MDWPLFFSFLSAVLSGVFMRIIFELFDDKYRKPVRNVIELRRKVLAALTMYAHFYTSPGLKLIPIEEQRKQEATWDLRRLASEIDGAIASFYQSYLPTTRPSEKIRKHIVKYMGQNIPYIDALRAIRNKLIYLSNSFYLPADGPNGRDNIELNDTAAKQIRELFTLPSKQINLSNYF